MIRTQWFVKENPVHVGEYETRSVSGRRGERRWWDGFQWSLFYYPSENHEERCRCARLRAGARVTAWRGQTEPPKP